MSRREWGLCALYVAAVVVTLSITKRYGELASVIDSALGIGLVIAIRTRLHELWKEENWTLRLLVLVLVAGVGVYLVTRGNGQIATASLAAFLVANGAATYVHALTDRPALVAVTFAAADSLIFPALAFGSFDVKLTLAQFAAKVGGALVYERLLFR